MILITGHRGFIGSKLSRKVDSFMGIDLQEGYDLLTCPLATNVLRPLGAYTVDDPVNVVYHLAAQTSVEASWHDPVHDQKNLLITARIAHNFPKAKIVYANSCASLNPKSPYGFSKKVCGDYLKLFHGNVVNCVFPNIYGPGSKSVVDIFKEDEQITIYGDGKAVRDYVHVDDIVEGLLKAKDWSPGEYHMGSEKGTTVMELALKSGKPMARARARKEEREVIVKNTTPDWKPTINVMDYL